ncbi:probable arsenite efflux transporter ArsB-like, puative [Rhynchosporium agropyri]|uniref:Probable arsenite efflux transporter ArsB-like, puative n=1 Tax=Rhynchosporium agropyri TaxID=914238 RepID=A0A1E1JRJ1_9HELO|nr:probable arsenite efflux transporter ArsB-like, puative [Rhynchosporium agropyri]
MATDEVDLDTGKIKEWRSIVTLIAFILTNLITLFPFHVPVYVPRQIYNISYDALSKIRVISPRRVQSQNEPTFEDDDNNGKTKPFVRFRFPLNFLTAPLIADLFLLAISAIGRTEVHDGTIGANHISPIDIMVFFITLAYIAISIDASGLIRYLAFKVLQKAGKVGHRLFFYLYAFFFLLGSFIGNDPIILSGTAFLAYMTRVSSNIVHPRAWIFSQFAIANIASAILVSSNPTNLVLAGAFQIRFIDYTANMIVPVVITAIVLFPFLLYIVFADESLIPLSIKMHELSDEAKARKPINPNIPHGRGNAEEEEAAAAEGEEGQLLSLEEIMNPFLDKGGAAFGAVIMAATLVTVLALNAAAQNGKERPVFWVTLPAAVVMFCWDVSFGWLQRKETREIARRGRMEVETARAERALREEEVRKEAVTHAAGVELGTMNSHRPQNAADNAGTRPPYVTLMVSESLEQSPENPPRLESSLSMLVPGEDQNSRPSSHTMTAADEKQPISTPESVHPQADPAKTPHEVRDKDDAISPSNSDEHNNAQNRTTLLSLSVDSFRWAQETFPTCSAVVAHLPFALVPFAFCMFVLVQALVTKGWVPVFAHGWDHWVDKTGTVGAIGGMAFISVILSNFAGTNIGTTILLSRVIQTWVEIHHRRENDPITNRTFWATVYSMAIGVNYGAFSTAFSASLAGLLWRDILARKHIHVRRRDFASVNLPIIAISMAVGCAVLVGEVYIMRDNNAYGPSMAGSVNTA